MDNVSAKGNNGDIIGLVFSRDQFKTLLRMIYIANTVANGYRDEGFRREYDDLEQYVFSRAGAAGFPAATWRHEVDGEEHHHPSRVFDSDPEVSAIMDEYEDALFLELLAERLAERDVERSHGPNAEDRMSENDYETLLATRTEEYLDHLKSEGLEGVRISGMGD